MTCAVCLGSLWVCEDDPDKPWQHDDCGGAGAPCACNPKAAVDFVKGVGPDARPQRDAALTRPSPGTARRRSPQSGAAA